MKDVTPETASEKRMIQEIQRATGALDNGVIGCQTLSDIWLSLCGAGPYRPLTLKIYGMPCIIARDVLPFQPPAALGVKAYENSMSGSFTWPSGQSPASILVSGGKTVRREASHAWLGFPETVIYRRKDGSLGWGRHASAEELPLGVKWAVGGMGLLEFYGPAAEGFAKLPGGQDYSDVLRRTGHAALGAKGGALFLTLLADMTGDEVNAFCRYKMKFDMAIMLDGGHIAAMNGAESFARVNTSQRQGYMIQAL